MSIPEHKKQLLIGTPSYDNWRAFRANEPLLGAFECLMYTDARMTGEITTGLEPYRFFNLVPLRFGRGEVRPAVAVRVDLHTEFETPPMERTEQSRYHGGWMTDEIAALASLACGVRFRSGGETREFVVNGDPQGRPIAWTTSAEPTLSIGMRGFVLPDITGEHSMMPIVNLGNFPNLTPGLAIALVRSARLYQDAIWLAESEPSLSWLMMVAAVETAAGYWRTSRDSPLDRLRESKLEFVEFLDGTGVEGLANRVAEAFADSIGTTKQFVDFLIAHLPGPPERRPPECGQVDWAQESLRKMFRQIYGYRSRALHDGMPFPAPMCEPPFVYDTRESVAERPMGLAMSTAGGTWLAKDTPMLLRTFEYIARNAINTWWLSMATAQ